MVVKMAKNPRESWETEYTCHDTRVFFNNVNVWIQKERGDNQAQVRNAELIRQVKEGRDRHGNE